MPSTGSFLNPFGGFSPSCVTYCDPCFTTGIADSAIHGSVK